MRNNLEFAISKLDQNWYNRVAADHSTLRLEMRKRHPPYVVCLQIYKPGSEFTKQWSQTWKFLNQVVTIPFWLQLIFGYHICLSILSIFTVSVEQTRWKICYLHCTTMVHFWFFWNNVDICFANLNKCLYKIVENTVPRKISWRYKTMQKVLYSNIFLLWYYWFWIT